MWYIRRLGSARLWRAGDRLQAIANFQCHTANKLHVEEVRFRRMRKPARCNRAFSRRETPPSLFFLHDEHEGTNQGGGQKEPDALQRPHITGHQHLADLLNRECPNVRRDNGQRLRF
jgi:hypothetical protein